MVNPVPGYRVTTPFGKRGSYWSCDRNSQGGIHTGADWACPRGTPVVAAIAGTIRHRNYGSAFGPYQFAISPSAGQPFADQEVFYAHTLDRLPDGTEVQVGQQVARVGALGNATGNHLHFELHSRKQVWNCGVIMDPQPAIDHAGGGGTPPSSGWMFPAGHKVYQKYLKVDGHELNQDRESDSIKALQEVLNRHSMPGGKNMPVTGKYWTATDDEVRLCQSLHLPPEDPEMKSYVGPGQWKHLAEATGCPYVWVPGDNTSPAPDPAPPPVQWFVPPSINKLLGEVNERWPDRDKSSDGTIGDYQHSKSQSEHNPVGTEFGPEFGTPGAVHAVDITADNPDLVQAVMKAAVGDDRVWYVIHDGKILSRTYDWANRDYNGSNPHETHIHISLRAEDKDKALFAENDTTSWLFPVLLPPDPEPLPDPEVVSKDEVREWMREGKERFGL